VYTFCTKIGLGRNTVKASKPRRAIEGKTRQG